MSYDDDAPPYVPMAPYYGAIDTSAETPAIAARPPRRGPLSSRLEARGRLTPAIANTASLPPDETTAQSGDLRTPSYDSQSLAEVTPGAVTPSAPAAWDMLTGILRDPGEADEALRSGLNFSAHWTSRADMLGACLDEYYQLTARYNDARTLLRAAEQELPPLRQRLTVAYATLRELEARIELHSRAELRTAYLGAAEIEMRVFRVEQERDLLSSRVETLEGFMRFLSRVIATIREIPAEVMDQRDLAAEEASDADDAALVSGEDVEMDGAVEEVAAANAQPLTEPVSQPDEMSDSASSVGL